ncbi:hypothetical protein LZ30DRAFT_195469 [Colletotrichum cereale]|nr:hypothetical protein LZ30DRAFT_195469 [Colletotrichum cereale]
MVWTSQWDLSKGCRYGVEDARALSTLGDRKTSQRQPSQRDGGRIEMRENDQGKTRGGRSFEPSPLRPNGREVTEYTAVWRRRVVLQVTRSKPRELRPETHIKDGKGEGVSPVVTAQQFLSLCQPFLNIGRGFFSMPRHASARGTSHTALTTAKRQCVRERDSVRVCWCSRTARPSAEHRQTSTT